MNTPKSPETERQVVESYLYGFSTDEISKKYKVSYWDPHYYPKNPPSNFTSHSFQTIFCTYILNVISKKERMVAIKKIQRLLHKDGKVFFTVRTSSDISEKASKNKWKKNSFKIL